MKEKKLKHLKNIWIRHTSFSIYVIFFPEFLKDKGTNKIKKKNENWSNVQINKMAF